MRPLAVSAYYGRLTQRLISAITAPTAEGRLYEVDMRLRPSGASGPIASNLAAFAEYQRLTAEGKLAEAGQKLDDLKRILDQLQKDQK